MVTGIVQYLMVDNLKWLVFEIINALKPVDLCLVNMLMTRIFILKNVLHLNF